MTATLPTGSTAPDLEGMGRALDDLYDETMEDRGGRDEHYLRRLISFQRHLAVVARVVILASVAFLPRWHWVLADWWSFAAVAVTGSCLLALAKVLENMEIGHNVLHGQWDWMGDPEIQANSWDWDMVCPADQWIYAHNVVHHTWTNVMGRDRDIGYDVLRVSDRQRWSPAYLLQPLVGAGLALVFEWGIALHDVDVGSLAAAGSSRASGVGTRAKGVVRKASRQVLKDYILWPLLAGPCFFFVAGANLLANVLRNVWAFVIIFCGHFPAGVSVFTEEDVADETRAQWYRRQVLGSCNIDGGRLFTILSGSLNYQIEHHLFPDMPSNRYPEVAPRVREICDRYGVAYNTGSLRRQFGTTTAKIWRLTFPGGHTSPAVAATV